MFGIMLEFMFMMLVSCHFIFALPQQPQQQQNHQDQQHGNLNHKIQLQNQGLSPNQVNLNIEQPMAAASSSYDAYSSASNNYGESYDSNYGFDCYGKKPAFYGDSNYDCKVYHVCQADGRSDSFRCPKWTRFNNYLGICDWHFKVDSYCNPLDNTNSYSSSSYGNSGYSGQSYGNSY